jgi:hypothetical protein
MSLAVRRKKKKERKNHSHSLEVLVDLFPRGVSGISGDSSLSWIDLVLWEMIIVIAEKKEKKAGGLG